jgi:RNA polymerase sigma-70 factor (ECF subfamily)
VATYVRSPGDDAHRAFAIGVLRIKAGRIAEMVAFHEPALFPAFGLPPTAPDAPPAPSRAGVNTFPPPRGHNRGPDP